MYLFKLTERDEYADIPDVNLISIEQGQNVYFRNRENGLEHTMYYAPGSYVVDLYTGCLYTVGLSESVVCRTDDISYEGTEFELVLKDVIRRLEQLEAENELLKDALLEKGVV